MDSPQNSPHVPYYGVTHTDGAAHFPFFSVLTFTLGDVFRAFSLGIFTNTVRQIHASAWLFQFLSTPR